MSSVQLLLNPNGMSPTGKIFLSWENICERFIQKFDEQFHGKRKAHFDTLPSAMRTVDGARGKWSLLILLDAIIYLLNDHHPTTTIRRYFNQHRVLWDSIKAELRAASKSYHELLELDFDNLCGDISVVFLPIHWVSLASFREYHLNNAPTKARTKFLSVLDTLTTHSCIRDCLGDLPYVLKKVVLKVISDHSELGLTGIASSAPARGAEPALHCPSPIPPRCPSRRSMSIDSGIEPNNMFFNTRSNSMLSSASLPFNAYLNNTPSISGQMMSARLSTVQHQQQSNPLPLQYPSTPMNQHSIRPTVSYGENDNHRISPYLMQQLPPALHNALFGVEMEESSSTDNVSSVSAGNGGTSSSQLTDRGLFSDNSHRSFDTLCPENEVYYYRPSYSTIDEIDSLSTSSATHINSCNMIDINSISNSISHNSLMLQPQPINMLPLDMNLLMDFDDSATPKDTYDWADFVEDFSRDDAECGDNVAVGVGYVSPSHNVSLPMIPNYIANRDNLQLYEDGARKKNIVTAASQPLQFLDYNPKWKVPGIKYMDVESPSSFAAFRHANSQFPSGYTCSAK